MEQHDNHATQQPAQNGAQQPQNQTQAQPAPQTQPPGRKPDYMAYGIQEGNNGKTYANKVGAAWQHKDGEGVQIKLDSVPVNGEISLRTLRENRMQTYQQQETELAQQPINQQQPTQGYEPQQ